MTTRTSQRRRWGPRATESVVFVALTALVTVAVVVIGFGPRDGAAAGERLAPGEDVVVGVQVPLTGPASFVGQGFRVGAELAADEINEAGGINGHRLVLRYVDDRGTPDGGVAAVRELVDRDQVFAVLGGSTSTATVAAVPYFSSNDKLYLASLASDPLVLEDFNRNIFAGATISQTDGTRAYVRYLTETLGAQRVAVMTCDQAHCTSGTPLLERQLEDAGVDVTATTSFTSGDTDFTGQVAQVRDSDPDSVFVFGLAADGGRILPQLRRAGVEVPIVGDTSLADPSVAEVAGRAAEGFTTFWLGGTQFIADDTGAMGEWLDSLDRHVDSQPEGTPNLYSMMAYSDVYVLAEAIRQAGESPTMDETIDQLEQLDGFVAGLDDTWPSAAPVALPRTFTGDDHQGNREVTPIQVDGGQFGGVDY